MSAQLFFDYHEIEFIGVSLAMIILARGGNISVRSTEVEMIQEVKELVILTATNCSYFFSSDLWQWRT